jgi:hypothetical protein
VTEIERLQKELTKVRNTCEDRGRTILLQADHIQDQNDAITEAIEALEAESLSCEGKRKTALDALYGKAAPPIGGKCGKCVVRRGNKCPFMRNSFLPADLGESCLVYASGNVEEP